MCTPIINLIRTNPKNEVMRSNLIGLIEHGAKINVTDSDGRDPIMHAIIKNNIMVVTILLENKRALKVN
jgi:ankyrin repeat protein